jgi:hypothetical protein
MRKFELWAPLIFVLLQDYYDYMLSYSPVDNIQETAYPNMLVLAGLHDPRLLLRYCPFSIVIMENTKLN